MMASINHCLRMSSTAPSTQDDWEAMKPVIANLYLRDNLRLKDVIALMREVHHFRATPRMYKAQFVKWNWKKYITANRLNECRSSSRRPLNIKGKKGVRRVYSTTTTNLTMVLSHECHTTTNTNTNTQPHPSLGGFNIMHNYSQTQPLHTAMISFRSLLVGTSNQDRHSQALNAFTKTPAGYNPLMISHFLGALLHFQNRSFSQGGRLLRSSFLCLENVLLNSSGSQSQSQLSLASIWDCFVSVPQLALAHGGRLDIVLVFLRYLVALSVRKLPGGHPVLCAGRALVRFFESVSGGDGDGGGGAAMAISEYAALAWRLWTDTLSRLGVGGGEGEGESLAVLQMQRAYLVCYYGQPPRELTESLVRRYERLASRAAVMLGVGHVATLGIEFEGLLVRVRFRVGTEEGLGFYERLWSILERLGSKVGNQSVTSAEWEMEERQTYRGCYFLGTMYALQMGDVVRAMEFKREFLRAPGDGDWVQYALRVEDMFRGVGMVREAEDVRRRREEVQFSREVVEVLDAEEREVGVL